MKSLYIILLLLPMAFIASSGQYIYITNKSSLPLEISFNQYPKKFQGVSYLKGVHTIRLSELGIKPEEYASGKFNGTPFALHAVYDPSNYPRCPRSQCPQLSHTGIKNLKEAHYRFTITKGTKGKLIINSTDNQ